MKISIQDSKKFNFLEKKFIKKKLFFKKNEKEVLREFNSEKWKKILDKIKSFNSVSINFTDKLNNNNKDKNFYLDGKFILKDNNKKIFKKTLEIYSKIIKKYIDKTKKNYIAELGAGYGSKIINLSNNFFNNCEISALDISTNAIKIAKKIKVKNKIKTGYCNFFNYKIDKNIVNNQSIIFTSYSLHYIPKHKEKIIDFFIKLNPKVVIFFEPCFELYPNTKYFELCKKYTMQNNYSVNLIKILKKFEKNKKIKILKIKKNVFGANPLLPFSIIVWKKYN